MSDELENVSVEGTTTESMPSAEPISAPEPVDVVPTESVPADERVFTPSTKIGNAEDYNRQQVAEENGVALGNGGVDGRTVTEAGHQAKAAAAEDKKAEFFQAQQQAEAQRKEWMEKDHDFGGMKISGHDLARMIDFISNPQMQDKLRDRLGKTGMPKDKIDKGMKELNEYIELKKKEQEGGKLTEEQQRRLKELEKSEEFRAVAQEAARQGRENGLISKKENDQDLIAGRSSIDSEARRLGNIQLDMKDTNLSRHVEDSNANTKALVGLESARQIFAGAPHAKDDFTVSASLPKPTSAANDTDNKLNQTLVAHASTTQQSKPKVLDVSFG